MAASLIGTALHGYISATLSAKPPGFGYGVSYYATAWALLEQPVKGLQVGSPSTWIIPDNSDFILPLCPPGTYARNQADQEVKAGARRDWSNRGPSFRDVFQTIEGGMGTWISLQFPSTSPKYRINGIPDCYSTQIGSPGWPFGSTTALPDQALGLAQLSNRLLIPPDGMPLSGGADAKRLGVAWIALPFIDYDGYFQLQSKQSALQNRALEGNRVSPESAAGGAAFMAPAGDFSGQFWKLLPHPSGWFQLTTLQHENDNLCLDGNRVTPGAPLGGAAFMAPRNDSDGQLWRLAAMDGGYYRLLTRESGMWTESLDSNTGAPDAPLGGASFMAGGTASPTQLWKLTPLTLNNDVATGDSAWTLFFSADNFKGPVAFFPPRTWSRISMKNLPAIGRGLDMREGVMGTGAMEVAVVPGFQSTVNGTTYVRIPRLLFPTETRNDALVTPLMQDITFYSRQALYFPVMWWFISGTVSATAFDTSFARHPTVQRSGFSFDQGTIQTGGTSTTVTVTGLDALVKVVDLSDSSSCAWGLQWQEPPAGFVKGQFPEFLAGSGSTRAVVPESTVPAEAALSDVPFPSPSSSQPYTSPAAGAWTTPGPLPGPLTVILGDGTKVTYAWYRFVDQPALQNLQLTTDEQNRLQARVEQLHQHWPIDQEYMPPPSTGERVAVDANLIVTPPAGREIGYVPIVIRQEKA